MVQLSENIGRCPGKPEIVRYFVTVDRLKHVFQGRYKSILVQNNAYIVHNIVINSDILYIFAKTQARTIIHKFSPGNIRAEHVQSIIYCFFLIERVTIWLYLTSR